MSDMWTHFSMKMLIFAVYCTVSFARDDTTGFVPAAHRHEELRPELRLHLQP